MADIKRIEKELEEARKEYEEVKKKLKS